jgi:hypothetical protein
MNLKEIQEIEDKLRIITPGVWYFNEEDLKIETDTGKIEISSALSEGQAAQDLRFMSESPKIVRELLTEIESQDRDIQYWKHQAQKALSESRSTKLDTIKGCIRLLRTIYLPTKAARDVLRQAKTYLEEFKRKDLSEMIDKQDDALVFDTEPPQIP